MYWGINYGHRFMGTLDIPSVQAVFSGGAFDLAAWSRALNLITAQAGAFGSILIPVAGSHLPNLPKSDRMQDFLDAYLCGGWFLRDERSRGSTVLNKNGIVDDLDINSFEVILRHPYYQQFLAPLGLRWFTGVKIAVDDELWCLSIQRTIEQGSFSSTEKQELAQLSGPLSSVAAMSRAIGSLAANAALNAFEVSGTAVLLVDRLGTIFLANRAAESLLGGDARTSKEILTAVDRFADINFNRALFGFLARTEDSPGSPIPLSRVGKRPLMAHPFKLNSVSTNALAKCQAAVVLVDPSQRWRPSEKVLQKSFGLTAAEARLASRVSAGETLDTIAKDLGIAIGTGRNQLKSVFEKTGVHRQAELVALCSSAGYAAMGLFNSAVPLSATS